jgi:hypothetical protein
MLHLLDGPHCATYTVAVRWPTFTTSRRAYGTHAQCAVVVRTATARVMIGLRPYAQVEAVGVYVLVEPPDKQ